MSGIAGEPAFAHAFFLLEEFLDGPEGGESYYAAKGAPEKTFDEKRANGAAGSEQQEYPPRACAEVVFCFDDDGMEYTDGYKGGEA
ncbi:DUF4491 domain-containing protein [Prevotella sp. MGM2]|nr:DUF4491 domain-containing protein [Prevotella sp. MGM2]